MLDKLKESFKRAKDTFGQEVHAKGPMRAMKEDLFPDKAGGNYSVPPAGIASQGGAVPPPAPPPKVAADDRPWAVPAAGAGAAEETPRPTYQWENRSQRPDDGGVKEGPAATPAAESAAPPAAPPPGPAPTVQGESAWMSYGRQPTSAESSPGKEERA